jgi:hypothetical protein
VKLPVRTSSVTIPCTIWTLVVALVLAPGCAARPRQPLSVAVLVDGDPAAVGVLARRAVAGLALQPVALAQPAPPPANEGPAIIARARAAYAQGEFATCRAELAQLDFERVLAAGDRALAARVLTFDAACAWGALGKADARAIAARLASLGLDLPEAAVAPDVEDVLARAIVAAGTLPRRPLAITGPPGGRLSIDGRAAGCALPCTVDVLAGDHVIAVDTDGFAPAARTVRTPDTAQLAIAQQPASPELAAQQWRARVGRGLPPTDLVGAALLGRLAGQARIALVHGGDPLSGALIVDGVVRASAVRPRGQAAALVRDLAYDGHVLERPSLWVRPWFWIAVSGAALALAGGVVYATYQPGVTTAVGFPR